MNDFKKIAKLGDQLQRTDYADPDSVRAHNQAADEISTYLSSITDENEMLTLLEDSRTKPWMTFHAADKTDHLSHKLQKIVMRNLKCIAAGDTTEAIAAKWKLKEINKRR